VKAPQEVQDQEVQYSDFTFREAVRVQVWPFPAQPFI
jgi:hypothetical protein